MGAPRGATAYLYNQANQLTHTDGITHTWDANGNLVHDRTTEALKDMKPLKVSGPQWSQAIHDFSGSNACGPGIRSLS